MIRIFTIYLCIYSIFFEIITDLDSTTDNNFLLQNQDTVIFDFEEKIQEYKNILSSDFIYSTYSCFLVISNLSEKELNKLINNTIANAEKCLYNDFFRIRPDEITTVLLFKNEQTYKFWAENLFNDIDISYFGYYKPLHKVIIMNISTGGGTLVHELTHVFVRYDFPDIPVWLNEGLGSLYERCTMTEYEIKGLTNWRLPTLQKSIVNGNYYPLRNMFNLSDEEFYGENSDFYYAQARYFCYYLQENGILKQFYKNFRDNYSKDSTGMFFIEEIFDNKIENIDSDFKKWVMNLKYD